MEDHQPIEHEADEQPTGGNCLRRSARDSLYLAATIRVDGQGKAATIRIRNLSTGGMLADDMPPCSAGDRVTVSFGRIGDVAGTVAWVDPDKAGIAFDAPIDPGQARRRVTTTIDRPRPAPAARTRRSGLRIE